MEFHSSEHEHQTFLQDRVSEISTAILKGNINEAIGRSMDLEPSPEARFWRGIAHLAGGRFTDAADNLELARRRYVDEERYLDAAKAAVATSLAWKKSDDPARTHRAAQAREDALQLYAHQPNEWPTAEAFFEGERNGIEITYGLGSSADLGL